MVNCPRLVNVPSKWDLTLVNHKASDLRFPFSYVFYDNEVRKPHSQKEKAKEYPLKPD